MRYVLVAALAVLAFGFAPPRKGKAEDTADAEARKKIVGTWLQDETENKVTIKFSSTYKADGTFDAKAVIVTGDEKIEFELSGTWQIKAGKLTSTLTKSGAKIDGFALGNEQTNEVLSVSDTELKLKTEDGQEKTVRRVME